jgi:hypothetical protein
MKIEGTPIFLKAREFRAQTGANLRVERAERFVEQ